jgi:hypothetical protein
MGLQPYTGGDQTLANRHAQAICKTGASGARRLLREISSWLPQPILFDLARELQLDAAAWAAGRSLTVEQAIAEAFEPLNGGEEP